MTEAEWLASTDPTPMLLLLESRFQPRQGKRRQGERTEEELPELLRRHPVCRKAWLFYCSCARRADSLAKPQHDLPLSLIAERRKGLGATERLLEGNLSEEHWADASVAHLNAHYDHATTLVAHLFYSWDSAFEAALDAVDTVAREHWTHPHERYEDHLAELPVEEQTSKRLKEAGERLVLSVLVRCVFGNPFRPVSSTPAWLTQTVTKLATVAYQERSLPSGELDAGRLGVLADALEEAGCSNADILGHLRSPGPHVRGCWAVDLLLGQE
jgi:hypothetical protein